MSKSDLRIPVEHQAALAVYFDVIVGCRFVLDGAECAANEVFHASAFLPLIAEIADRACRHTFGQSLGVKYEDDDGALLGRRVLLPRDVDEVMLLKLLWGAEMVFRPTKGSTVELLPLYEYCWAPESARKPPEWLPAHLR